MADFEQYNYSPIEMEYRTLLIKQMNNTRDQREARHDEFNGMTYSEWYKDNAKVRNGYKEPKKNANEVRITSGTVMEKTNSFTSSLLNLNLKPSLEAYDEKGGMVEHIGNLAEDLISKSNELEEPTYEEKKSRIIDEFDSQGTMFSAERTIEFTIPSKTVTELNLNELDKLKWEEGMEKYHRYCDTELLIGLNVYLGNIKEPYMQKQPFVFVRKLIPKQEAKAMYGNWNRWKNVPLTLESFISNTSDEQQFNNWTLEGFDQNFVEDLEFYDKWGNNFMKILNGTMMFPVKKVGDRFSTLPLSVLTGVSIIPIAKADFEPINNWAYSRSVPSKNITDQALFDEFLRSMVIKTRQSYNPPVGNLTGEEISSDIFDPGTSWTDIDPDKIKPLIDSTGVTQAEFNMMQFVKSGIDTKSVSPTFEGQEGQTGQTLGEIEIQQRQSMKNMTMAIEGLINWEKQRTILRLYNIINTWTLPEVLKNGVTQMVDEYKTLTIDTELEDGDGKRIIDFREQLPTERQAQAESRILSKVKGMRIQKDYVNPKVLKQGLRYFWKVNIVPTPKTDSALAIAQFSDFVKTELALSQAFGVPLQGASLMKRMAILQKEDPDKVIQENPQGAMPQMPQGGQQGEQQGGGTNAQLTPNKQPQPTVNATQGG